MAAITLTLAKQFLRYDTASQDDVIDLALRSGQEWVEKTTGIAMTSREVVQQIEEFCGPIELQWWPVTDLGDIDYIDTEGAADTITDGRLLNLSRPAKVQPAFDGSWPQVDTIGPHSVTYTAGYADPEDIPAPLLHAMLLIAGNFDANRSAVVTGTIANELPLGVEALCSRYILYKI